uniref:DUF19 domain-containing protein n=1 Tax=Parascaris univalens TaxID=6257 RepID=A0A914ZNN4_PARUN
MSSPSGLLLTVFMLLIENSNSSTEERAKCSAFTEQAVSKCMKPMLDYAGKLQSEAGDMQFPVQGSDIFQKLCRIYLEFKECTRDVNCASLSVDAVDASYGYMCGTGYKLFEKHAMCFAEVEAQKDYVKCKVAASQAISDSQKLKGHDNNQLYFKALCSIMDDYLRCSHPIINRHCGTEAWDLVTTVTTDSLRVTMPTCDMHNALL